MQTVHGVSAQRTMQSASPTCNSGNKLWPPPLPPGGGTSAAASSASASSSGGSSSWSSGRRDQNGRRHWMRSSTAVAHIGQLATRPCLQTQHNKFVPGHRQYCLCKLICICHLARDSASPARTAQLTHGTGGATGRCRPHDRRACRAASRHGGVWRREPAALAADRRPCCSSRWRSCRPFARHPPAAGMLCTRFSYLQPAKPAGNSLHSRDAGKVGGH